MGNPSSTASKPAGRSGWTGSAAPAPPTVGRKPSTGPGFDATAGRQQRLEESRVEYEKGQAPKPNYRDATGSSRPIDPRDRQIEDLRRQLDAERWRTRPTRQRDVFRDYPGPNQPPVIVYQDPYSNVFWWWLLAQSLETRATWAYHHRDAMDAARYRDLLSRDAQLEGRIRELEDQKIPRDPTQKPANLPDTDLMYSDEYADAAFNPQSREPPRESVPAARGQVSGVWRFLIIAVVTGFLIWLVFIKRWGGT